MVKKNEQTIEAAFKRLAQTKHTAMIDGMKALLDAAVVFALQVHEERYLHNHLETGDSYGWALGYKGQCVDYKVTTWEDLPTTDEGITETLTKMAINLSSKNNKYVGIVMAGMSPAHYYNVTMEEDVLALTIDMTASDFDRYFHEV